MITSNACWRAAKGERDAALKVRNKNKRTEKHVA